MFSIIVPVYNADKFLNETLQSIQDQTNQDFECVFVNDESTDNSLSIIQDFVTKNPQHKIIQQKHHGLIYALKHGVREATSDYICFLDADDKLFNNMAEVLNNLIQKYKPEAIQYDYYSKKLLHFSQLGLYKNKPITKTQEKLYTDINLSMKKQDFLKGRIPALRWNKLMTKNLFNKFLPYYDDQLSYHEDLLFSTLFYHFVENLVITPYPLMEYINRPDSMSHSFNQNALHSCELIIHTLTTTNIHNDYIVDYLRKRIQTGKLSL